MLNKVKVSRGLAFIFFCLIFILDWLYILGMQNEAPTISHWVTTLPIIATLLVPLALLALIGMYYSSIWGFILAYVVIIFSMHFAYVSYFSNEIIETPSILTNIPFMGLTACNLLVFIYIVIFHYYTASRHIKG